MVYIIVGMWKRFRTENKENGRKNKMLKNPITIKDIAKEAGVSVSTVSRAINNAERVDKKTKEHIEKIINDLGYSPNVVARSLKTRRTRNIVLIVPDVTNPFYADIAKKLQVYLKQKNYIMSLFNTNENLNDELCAIESARENFAGGIIFASVAQNQCVIDTLKKVNIPCVLLNSYLNCGLDSIHGEYGYGTFLSTKYLIENGHRRIAFIGGIPGTVIGQSRKEGYIRALTEAGLEIDKRLIFEMNFSEDAGYKGSKYLTALKPMPTAICCANDMIAIGVLSSLREDGISVPEQISVTGIDDIMYSRISSPPLTTVTNDADAFAKQSFKLLFDQIEKTHGEKHQEVIIERTLVIRESVKRIL